MFQESEKGCRAELQDIVDLIVFRMDIDPNLEGDFTMLWKIGFDGTSGFSEYHKTTSCDFDENSVFTTAIVPLICSNGNQIAWRNDKMCSSRICRTVQFQFKKEDHSLIKDTYKFYLKKSNELNPTILNGSIGFIMTLNLP